jgi:high-affinity iron transporter
VLAAAVSYALYRGLMTIPMRHFFTVTNWLIALLAAGMAGQAASVLASADLIPSWGERIWNTSFILADDSWLGRALHALVGYSAMPSGIQMAAYVATLAMIVSLTKFAQPEKPRAGGAAIRGGSKIEARG